MDLQTVMATLLLLWMLSLAQAMKRPYSSWPVYNLSKTPVASGNPACNVPPAPSTCTSYQYMWYYSFLQGACVSTSGCQTGKQLNLFLTGEQCEATCIYISVGKTALDPNSICRQPANKGLCRAKFYRWRYNHDEGACQPFVGCYAAGNNFDTRNDCERTCLVFRSRIATCNRGIPKGRGKARIPQWTYNTRTGSCELFFFAGGQPSTQNHFNTENECMVHCGLVNFNF